MESLELKFEFSSEQCNREHEKSADWSQQLLSSGDGEILFGRSSNRFYLITDVGFPSVCCKYALFSLVNKEAVLVFNRAE